MSIKTLSAKDLRELERQREDACNAKQIAFVRNVVFEQMGIAESYLAAGYESEKPQQMANRMLKKNNIIDLQEVYLEGRRRQALISHNNLQLAALEVLERSIENEDRPNALRAIDQLTKMTGGYAPTHQRVEVEEKRPVQQLDQETLRELFKTKRLQAVNDNN